MTTHDTGAEGRSFRNLLSRRRSWLGFSGEAATVTDVLALADLAAAAPSEQNLQPWRLIVAEGDGLRRLLPALLASNVAKAEDAGLAVVFVGDEAAIDDDELAARFYETRSRRDFAVRNTSMFLMTFLLAAEAHGYVTRPLAGFHEKELTVACGLAPSHVPVAVVLLGKAPGTEHPETRAVRVPAAEFVAEMP